MLKRSKMFACCLLFMLVLPLFGSLVSVGAVDYYVFGNTSYSNAGSGSYPTSADSVLGGNITVVGPIATYNVSYVAVRLYSSYFPILVKGMVLNSTGHILALSEVYEVDANGVQQFTFSETLVLSNNTSYVVAYISANQTGYAYSLGGGTTFRDLSNLYATPVDATDGVLTSTAAVAYAYCVAPDAEPTEAPATSAPPTSTGLSDSALNTLLGNLFWWLAVLIIVLGPAFVFGVLFKGGTWGFLVGLLAGAGLGYWLMPSLVPLWLVVGVVFAVAAMAWSVMGRSS